MGQNGHLLNPDTKIMLIFYYPKFFKNFFNFFNKCFFRVKCCVLWYRVCCYFFIMT